MRKGALSPFGFFAQNAGSRNFSHENADPDASASLAPSRPPLLPLLEATSNIAGDPSVPSSSKATVPPAEPAAGDPAANTSPEKGSLAYFAGRHQGTRSRFGWPDQRPRPLSASELDHTSSSLLSSLSILHEINPSADIRSAYSTPCSASNESDSGSASGTPNCSASRSLKYSQSGPTETPALDTATGITLHKPFLPHPVAHIGSAYMHFDLEEDPSFWKEHNVQVLIRIRPLSTLEIASQGQNKCIRQDSAHTLTWTGHPESRFTFDHVACETITQESLFKVAGLPVVENCLLGFNSCIFAYGQTGSGKTHTMLGDLEAATSSKNRGMTPRVFEYLFARIEKEEESRSHEHLKFSCKCSFLEIYNEQITDLLGPTVTNLQIREDNKKGAYVENLTEVEVQNVNEIIRLLLQGATNRKVASTNMNSESSRSHSVFTCVIENKWENQSITCIRHARLNLVDLAGSERQKSSGAEGERLKEAANINKSLSTLGLVIMSLVDKANGKQRHVPYRDSKLTFLLHDSLGGSSKTTIIANISPSSCCAMETLSTLKFAQRAKFIRNNATINEEASGDVTALRMQIQHLKEEINQMRVKNMDNNTPNICSESFSEGINSREYLDLNSTSHSFYSSRAWDSMKALPFSFSSKKKRELESAFLGSLRREKAGETTIRDMTIEIEHLKLLVKQRGHENQCVKMMLRLREDKIKKLESFLGGLISTDTYLDEEKDALVEELHTLRMRLERNPEVTRFAMENIRLTEELRRYEDFYANGERDLIMEEITILRDQLLDALDWKLMHEEGSDATLPNCGSSDALAGSECIYPPALVEENQLLRMEAEKYHKEVDDQKRKLNLCLEEKLKLERHIEELQSQIDGFKNVISSDCDYVKEVHRIEDVTSTEHLLLEKKIQAVEAVASMHVELLSMREAVSAASAGEMEARNCVSLLTNEIEVLTNDIQSLQIGLEELRVENSQQCRIFESTLKERDLKIMSLEEKLLVFEEKDAKIVELTRALHNVLYAMENNCLKDADNFSCMMCKKMLKARDLDVQELGKLFEGLRGKDCEQRSSCVVDSAGDKNIDVNSGLDMYNEALDIAQRLTVLIQWMMDKDRCFSAMHSFHLELEDIAMELQTQINHLQEMFLGLSPAVTMTFDSIKKFELEEELLACQLDIIEFEVKELCVAAVSKDDELASFRYEQEQREHKLLVVEPCQDDTISNIAVESSVDVRPRFVVGPNEMMYGSVQMKMCVMQDKCNCINFMQGFYLELQNRDKELQRGMDIFHQMFVDVSHTAMKAVDAITKMVEGMDTFSWQLECVEHEVRELKRNYELDSVDYGVQQAQCKEKEPYFQHKFHQVFDSVLEKTCLGGERNFDIKSSRLSIGCNEDINKPVVDMKITQEMYGTFHYVPKFYQQLQDKDKELQKRMDQLQEMFLEMSPTVAAINKLQQEKEGLSYQLDRVEHEVREFTVACGKNDEQLVFLEEQFQHMECKLREAEKARDDVFLLSSVERQKLIEEKRILQKQIDSMFMRNADRDRLLNEELNITQLKVDCFEKKITELANYVDLVDKQQMNSVHDKDLRKIVQNACGHVLEKERELESLKESLDGDFMRASQAHGKVNGLKAVLNSFSSAKDGWNLREREIRQHVQKLSNIVSEKQMEISCLQSQNCEKEILLQQFAESEETLEQEMRALRLKLEMIQQQRFKNADSVFQASMPLLDLLKGEEERASMIMKLNETQLRLQQLRTDGDVFRAEVQKQDTAILFAQVELDEAVRSLSEAEYEMNEVLKERETLLEAEEEARSHLCSVLAELEEHRLQIRLKEEEIHAKGSYLDSLGSTCSSEGKLGALSGGLSETLEREACDSKLLIGKFTECKKHVGEINQILQRLTNMKTAA